MKELCGNCCKSPCECAELTTRHPAEWAFGQRLTDLAQSVGLDRGPTESDDTLRARLQFTIIHGTPFRSGIPAGKLLDGQASRHGVYRYSGETDPKLLARLLLTVAKGRAPESTPVDAIDHEVRSLQHSHRALTSPGAQVDIERPK